MIGYAKPFVVDRIGNDIHIVISEEEALDFYRELSTMKAGQNDILLKFYLRLARIFEPIP